MELTDLIILKKNASFLEMTVDATTEWHKALKGGLELLLSGYITY